VVPGTQARGEHSKQQGLYAMSILNHQQDFSMVSVQQI